MIISRLALVPSNVPGAFAWSSLRRFWNVDFVFEKLCDLHQVQSKHHINVRKQAEQLRYCLIQAREYAQAAQGVTLATKPVLLYYSIMSLALAEILLKQSGDSSLDRSRTQHAHHGLEFVCSSDRTTNFDLAASAQRLRAKPATSAKGRFGTFELWHRSCREMPIGGTTTLHFPNGAVNTRHAVILGVEDERLSLVPDAGLSLLHVLQHLPALADHLGGLQIWSQTLRCKLESITHNSQEELRLTIHPTGSQLLDQFISSCSFDANAHPYIEFEPIISGGQLKWTLPPEFGSLRFLMPHAVTWRDDEVRFWPNSQPLNEFGFYYLGLYIAANDLSPENSASLR